MHQLLIATSLQLLLPVIQTIFFSVTRFLIRRKKNLQKLIVIFLDQNRRNLTPQKLPVIQYWFEKHSFYLSIDHLHISHFVSKIIHLTVISLYGRQFTNYFKIILKNWCPLPLLWPSIIVQFDLLAYHMTSSCTVWQALVLFDKFLYCLSSSCTISQALVLFDKLLYCLTKIMYCLTSSCTVW